MRSERLISWLQVSHLNIRLEIDRLGETNTIGQAFPKKQLDLWANAFFC